MDWSWWWVFLPTWLVLFGQLVSYYVDYSLARNLAAGTEGKAEEDMTQVRTATFFFFFQGCSKRDCLVEWWSSENTAVSAG